MDCDQLKRELPDLVAVYQFGSTVEGTERRGSDVDLAVLTTGSLDTRRRWTIQQDLARRLRRDVDLVDLRRAPTVLQIEVVARGARLCCFDDSVAERFENFVFTSYAFLNEERRSILEQVRAEGRILAG